ncbi:MAG TPA: thiamine pyrophosphate-dependent enzyme, partial [Actinomycetota bacterium]|nr:thiamine pyrophosphate-dependent enzyme [Actinomycetota bacterium]
SRSIASRAFAEAVGSPRGPVHLNLAFREPFIAESHDEEVDISGRPEGRPWTQLDAGRHELAGMDELATRIEAAERGMLVVGAGEVDPMAVERFARTTGWPVIAEAHSGCRTGKHVISLYDAIIRCTPFAQTHTPDLVIRLGSIGTSRRLTEFLRRGPEQISIDRDGRWLDPSRALTKIVRADPSAALDDLSKSVSSSGSSSWINDWQEAESAAEGAADSAMAELGLCEPVAARVVTQSIPGGSTLLVASSMPIRDVDWFMLPRPDLEVQSNRGTNGIDGFISTAVGLAMSGKQTFGLCGDLAFLHDVGGLLTARMNDVAATIVVLNNDGGGIFGFLSQRDLGETFTRLFATPHGSDIGAIAESFGCAYTLCQSPADLRALIAEHPAKGIHILEVRTALDSNVSAHERIWASVDEAVRK